jgi:hypothetical protein
MKLGGGRRAFRRLWLGPLLLRLGLERVYASTTTDSAAIRMRRAKAAVAL